MKRKRFPQDFLFECDFNRINLEEYAFKENLYWIQSYKKPLNLFDFTQYETIRSVSVSELNRKIKTEQDWKIFIDSIRIFTGIIFIREKISNQNPVIKRFEENQIKAYIAQTLPEHKKVYWANHDDV